ncbi:MAG: hypothetical protein JXB05_09395 [Myxococcaceae bacterium]|nr:hypothetical protein [Myxococcaceae bacterium]
MKAEMELPGLKSLMEVCEKHGLFLKTLPPEEMPPAPGEMFLGQPFDPILATLYRKFGAAMLGDFQLYSWGSGEGQLSTLNEGMRRFGDEPYLSSLLFGQIPMLAYYLATVPPLADARGIQPVIFIDAYEDNRVMPVASSVDAFFTTFSMYLERAVRTPEYAVEHRIGLHFPSSVADLVARDRSLLDAISSGHFKRLMRDDEESRKWISRISSAGD